MISRVLAFVGGSLIGGGVGYLVAMHQLDNKYMEQYQESTESARRAMEVAVESARSKVKNVFEDEAELRSPAETEEELTEPMFEITPFPGTQAYSAKDQPDYSPAEDNPYHKALNDKETPVDVFVDGGVNDYGVSYIEEDEYMEDDGRSKEQITILMDEHNPLFLQDGGEIRDWDEKVGDSILIDMFKLCPPGTRQVLYVRNHRTDVDYEVVRDTP